MPIRDSLIAAAAAKIERPAEECHLSGGFVLAAGEQVISIAEAAKAAGADGLPLKSEGYYAMEYPEEPRTGAYPYAHQVFTFGAQVAKVLVDIETGQIEIEELTVVQDAGRVINPGGAVGQLEGGAAMGVGYALLEDLQTVKGRTINNSLESYLIPTAADIPPMKTGLLQTSIIHHNCLSQFVYNY